MLLLLAVFIFQILLNPISGSPERQTQTPTLEFKFLGSKWEKLSMKKENITLFSSTTGDDIYAQCKAPYPIQWVVTGIISPADIIHIVPTKRDLENGVYEIEFHAFFLDGANSSDALASAIVSCEMIGNHHIRSEMSVFVRGKQGPLIQAPSRVITNSNHIPCPTTDPTQPTALYALFDNGTESLIDQVFYLPTEGFYSEKVFVGNFACKQDGFSVVVKAIDTRVEGYGFSPSNTLVRSFADEHIELECSSLEKTIKLSNDNNDAILESRFMIDTDKRKVIQLSINKTQVLNKTVITGKVSCYTHDQQLIKEWMLEFIEAPQLYLDNYEGEIDCLSSLSPKMVQSVRCKNTMECNFMRHCFNDVKLCNYKKQKQFYATTDTYCWVDHLETGKECASLPFSHLNGMAQCNVLGLTRQWEFFVSLGYGRYSNWKDAPVNELIRLDETTSVQQEGTSQFLCTTSAYLFTESITFEVEYKNGTRRFILGKPYSTKYATNSTHRRIYELNHIAGVDLTQSSDITAIHCIASFWNSTDSLRATKLLTRRSSHALSTDGVNFEGGTFKERFYVGESNRSLTCFSAAGEKYPVYSWQFKIGQSTSQTMKNVSLVFPELSSVIGEHGEGILQFSNVEMKYAGDYQCLIQSNNSSTIRKFKLEIYNDLNI